MNLHEFQAKTLLSKYGIESPPFRTLTSDHEFLKGWDELNLKEGVLKIQIHAGGRGKAGGIKKITNKNEGLEVSRELLRQRFVTKQTGSLGLPVKYLMLTTFSEIMSEYYLSITYDVSKKEKILIVSSKGGVDIEETAAREPEKIATFSLKAGLKPFHLINICKILNFSGALKEKIKMLLIQLNKAFDEEDATLIEINPLILTKDNQLVVLDVRMTVDEAAFFRHPYQGDLFDATQYPKEEVQAYKVDLSYVSLEGTIGCMVNGAGLAMATLDLLHRFGGTPANFLDVGGGADEDKISKGFDIILEDTRVKALFVNIFGGIMDCSKIAQALVNVFSKRMTTPPTVVRMEGTNVDKAKEILSGLKERIYFCADLEEAAKKAASI